MSDVIFNRPQETKTVTSVFYGINKGERIPDGCFRDTLNMTGDKYPCLATRSERKKVNRQESLAAPGEPVVAIEHNGAILLGCSNGKLIYEDKEFECDTEVTDVVAFGNMAYCIPSGVLIDDDFSTFNETRVSYKKECDVSASDGAIKITDTSGTGIGGMFGVDSFNELKEGDAVTICIFEKTDSNENVLEIETYVSKVEGVDILLEGTIEDAYTGIRTVHIMRKMPTLQFAVTHNNRIWGCFYDGDINEIYASKLGDPLCWKSYRGLATDSYAVSCGDTGEFTGCTEMGNVIVFFKENCIYTIYGTEPSNFQTVKTDCFGVQKGSENSIVKINGQVYYKSCHGIMRLSEGGLPVCISDDLGIDRWSEAIGGTDGRKYYVVMKDIQGNREMYCYDTKTNVWHKEEECCKNLFRFVNFKNNLLCIGKEPTAEVAKEKRILLITEDMAPKRKDFTSSFIYNFAKMTFTAYIETYKTAIKGKSDAEIKEWYAQANELDVSEVTDEQLAAFLSLFYKRIASYVHKVEFSYITNEAGCNVFLPASGEIAYELSDEGRFHWSCETGIRGFEASEYKRLKCVELRMKLCAGARCDVSIEYDSTGKWESVYSFDTEGMTTYRIKDRFDKCDTYRLRLQGYGKMVLYSIGEVYEEAGNIGF